MPITPTVKQVLIVNFLFFAGSQLLGDVAYEYLSLYDIENNSFRIWQPLTHMFMHASVYQGNFSNIMHIAFNMFALYSFGSILEHYWGGIKFLFFYISCGLGAALLHSLVNYVQIQLLLDQLSQLSLSASDLHVLLNANYSTVFDENGQLVAGQVSSIMSNASRRRIGCNIWFVGSLCFYGSQCRVGIDVYTNSHQSQVFCTRTFGCRFIYGR